MIEYNEFRFQLSMLRVGEESQNGDCICLRWGFNLDSDNPDQFVMIVDCGFASNASALSRQIKAIIKTDHINALIITHPHADHIGAMPRFLNDFKIDELIVRQPWQHQDLHDIFKPDLDAKTLERLGLKQLYDLVENANRIPTLKVVEWHGGDVQIRKNVTIHVLGAKRTTYDDCIRELNSGRSHIRALTESEESRLTKFPDDDGDVDPVNNSSYILAFSFEGLKRVSGICKKWILLTSDAGPRALRMAIDAMDKERLDYQELRFLQLPHHGSINNLREDILDSLIGDPSDAMDRPAGPGYAAASVSKQSDNMHPHSVVCNALEARNMKVSSTKNGTYTYNLRIRLDK